MKAELLDGVPTESMGMISDFIFINSDLFIAWYHGFIG